MTCLRARRVCASPPRARRAPWIVLVIVFHGPSDARQTSERLGKCRGAGRNVIPKPLLWPTGVKVQPWQEENSSGAAVGRHVFGAEATLLVPVIT